jgi:hypothetical protein
MFSLMAFAQKPFESFRRYTPWAGPVSCSITALSLLCRVQSTLIIECHISEYITLSFFAELGIRKNEIRENLVCDLPRACVNLALTGLPGQFRVRPESRYKTAVTRPLPKRRLEGSRDARVSEISNLCSDTGDQPSQEALSDIFRYFIEYDTL